MTKRRESDLGIDPQLEAAGDLGGAWDDWVSDGMVAGEAEDYYLPLQGTDEPTHDIEKMFVAFRCAQAGPMTYPTEVALAGFKGRRSNMPVWVTKIAPHPSWLDQMDHEETDTPDEAPPASQVAREIIRRVRRTPSGELHSQYPEIQAAMLKMLMDLDPDMRCTIPVSKPTFLSPLYPNAEAAEEHLQGVLNARRPDEESPKEDPREEVEILVGAWFFGYRWLPRPSSN